MTTTPMNPITEDDIANFLVNTPDFFVRHAEVLSTIRMTSPHGNRAVSLQERQAEMLREKIRALEMRIMEMIRHGNENDVLSQRMYQWAQNLLLSHNPSNLPMELAQSIERQFLVPQVALKIWNVAKAYEMEPYVLGATEEDQKWADSLVTPYCGANSNFNCVKWLAHPSEVQSIACIPLKPLSTDPDAPVATQSMGLMILASPDPQRYHANMGTDLLERIGLIASAALSRLR